MLLGLNGKGCCEDLYWASGFNIRLLHMRETNINKLIKTHNIK